MTSEKFNHLIQKTAQLLPVLLFVCALYIVHKQLESHNLNDILASLQTTPLFNITGALLLTAINYLVLAAYDFLALRFTGYNHIPLKKMLAAALLGYAISNNR